jgi:molybdenum cofactor cytidylyltransferase
MGAPKFSLVYRPGVCFLEQCVSQFHLFGCSKIIVVVNDEGKWWIDSYQPALKNRTQVVKNPYPERGRLFSVQSGLAECGNAKAVFILNVDNPFVNQATLRLLRDISLKHTGFDYISPRYKGMGGHPIMISERLVGAILKEPAAGTSLKQILSHYKCTDLEVDDPGILININTMADYREAGLPLGTDACRPG